MLKMLLSSKRPGHSTRNAAMYSHMQPINELFSLIRTLPYLNDYKNKSRRLLVKSLELYERGKYDEAYVLYEGAIQFNPDSEHIAMIKGKSLDGFKNLRQSRKDISLSTEAITIENDDDDGGTEEPDFAGLLTEGYEGFRSRAILFLDDVSDPDEYDEYYNQHYERDLGDEIDASFEREGYFDV